MKSFLLTILTSVCVIGHAQNLKLGLRSGVTFSNFYSHQSHGEIPDHTLTIPSGPVIILPPGSYRAPTYYFETDFIRNMRTGLFSYLYIDFEIKTRLSAEIGLGYTQRGIDIDFSQHSITLDSDNNTVTRFYKFKRNLRLDYISIPMTLHYKLDKKERFYIVGGIYNAIAVNFLIKESLVLQNQQTVGPSGNMVITESTSRDINAYAKRFDSGLLAGVGINVPLTPQMTFGADLRSALGLINLPGNYEEYGFQSFSDTSKNISIEAGLKLQYILQ